jgi:hypothetical protein
MFHEVRLACAMVQVPALVGSAVVEIEADAMVGGNWIACS